MHVVNVNADPPDAQKLPLIFVHGGSHTGACYLATPDGRAGWATLAAARGRSSYVVDWPGRGDAACAQPLHTLSLRHVADELATLLVEVGPAVLVTHSMGAVAGWRAAEVHPERVGAIVAIAPGPPANLQPALDGVEMARLQADEPERWALLGRPFEHPVGAASPVRRDLAIAMWANSERFPHAALESYLATLVAESPRALNERNNLAGTGVHLAGPQALATIPIVVITGDQDPRHPRATDQAVATYVGGEFIWLADRGITGHGHLMMIERGNDVIADIFLHWLDERGI